MHKARLFCKTGQFAGKEFEIGSETLIGRSQTNTVALSSEAISSHHARIFFDTKTERFVLEDLGSRNGTRLDGMRVRTPEPLDALNVITFADAHDFIFQSQISGIEIAEEKRPATAPQPALEEKTMFDEAPLAPPPVDSSATSDATVIDEGTLSPLPAAPAPPAANAAQTGAADEKTIMDADIVAPPAPPTPPAPPAPVDISTPQDSSPDSSQNALQLSFSLYVTKTGTSFPLAEGEQTLGRTGPCDIIIAASSISRKHARLVVTGGVVTITDLGSKNGVIINGSKTHAPADIKPGDSIRIGEVDVELRQ